MNNTNRVKEEMEELKTKSPLEFYIESAESGYGLPYRSRSKSKMIYGDGTKTPRISVRGLLEQFIVNWDYRYSDEDLNAMEERFKPKYDRHQLLYGSTRKDIAKDMLSYLREGDIFIDLGSEIGLMCLLAVENGAERAIGIEIQPKLVALFNSLITDPQFYLGPKDRKGFYRCLQGWLPTRGKIVDGFKKEAMKKLDQACTEIKEFSDCIDMSQGDILTCKMPKGNFIYSGMELSSKNWEKLLRKIDKEVENGTRIAVMGKHTIPGKNILDSREYHSAGLLGGSSTTLTIYEI